MNEQLKVIISAEIAKFKKATDEAKKEALSFKQQVEKAGKDVEETFKKMGSSITQAGKAMAVGVAAVAAATIGLVNSTEEYRKSQAQLKTAFEIGFIIYVPFILSLRKCGARNAERGTTSLRYTTLTRFYII